MQLAGIKISNLYSFPYLSDIHAAQEVLFRPDQKHNVNVLIWPNGAGKSKFIEVIKRVLRDALRKDYSFRHQLLLDKKADCHEVIVPQPVYLKNIYPHSYYADKPSEVMIRLTLTENDYQNLRFLCEHLADINALIGQYSSLDFRFAPIDIDEIVLSDATISLHCVFDFQHSDISVLREWLSPIQAFILDYLLHSELLQICIDIHNHLVGKEDWEDLRSTFAILGFDRTTSWLFSIVYPHERNGFLYEKGQYSARAWYYLCAQKIWQLLSPVWPHMPDVEVQRILSSSEWFVSLSALLYKYFSKTLHITFSEYGLGFSFLDEQGKTFSVENFSDGEQSLLIIIFAIYGYDLAGGLLIIDEPEMHFHPQMQRSLSRMMEKISKNIRTQFVLATYSPLFINETNINHVYRFAKEGWATLVKSPVITFSWGESSLIHLLKFENMSKVFFVNKIIMVEWETDAYFFEYYLNYLHSLPQWKGRVKDYEIININGKWSYKVRKKFLSKFGITSYFIWDWDNIVDYGFLSQDDLTYYYKQAKSYFPKAKKTVLRGSHYNKLVVTIRDRFPAIYNELLGHIHELYSQHVFILERWDIETYIPLQTKWLESTVYFCHHDFKKWLTTEWYEPHRKELDSIFSAIFPW